MASGMGTEKRDDLGHVPNLHDLLRGLFEADWAELAESCESIATQVKTTDWEDTLDMDDDDADDIQAVGHLIAKLCEKVKEGWGSPVDDV